MSKKEKAVREFLDFLAAVSEIHPDNEVIALRQYNPEKTDFDGPEIWDEIPEMEIDQLVLDFIEWSKND